jgi:arsenate reductase (thioredoxin)
VTQPRPVAAPEPASKKRVLFVCIGNSCRSQMAEAFARAYGADVIEARSAGVAPASVIMPQTRRVLHEKNVRSDGQFPKGLELVSREPFDLVINMSGRKLESSAGKIVDWPVKDPIGQTDEVYRAVAAEIESLVMRLILELRSAKA